jgi:SAM-dependent methyltransferase
MRKPLFIARQGRRPAGLLGHIVARVMARETAIENARTLDLLDLRAGDRVLEVGCGHGHTLSEAANRADGITATGIDFSDVMIRVARRWNRRLIAAERVQIDRGDSAALPYADHAFTKVYAVHTVYFWERATAHLREVFRVLAPGGRFVLGFRPGDDPSFSAQFPSEVYHIRSAGEIEAMVATCGFDAVWTEAGRVKGHVMAWTIARKSVSEVRVGHADVAEEDACV